MSGHVFSLETDLSVPDMSGPVSGLEVTIFVPDVSGQLSVIEVRPVWNRQIPSIKEERIKYNKTNWSVLRNLSPC